MSEDVIHKQYTLITDYYRPISLITDYYRPISLITGYYRPISLTSVVCKTMERLVKGRLITHLEMNNLIGDSQHGSETNGAA